MKVAMIICQSNCLCNSVMGVFFVSLQLELVDGRDKPGNRVFRIVSPNNVRSLGDEVICVTVSREKYNFA